jgi:sec-independent protein translocase protein TatB
MFDIGWSEMAIIMLVALIVIGPKDLPRVARNVGRWVGKGRALAREFQSQLEDMAREAELDTVKKEIEKAGRTDVKRSIERTVDPDGDLGTAFDTSSEDARKAPRKKKAAANGSARTEGAGAAPPSSGPVDAAAPAAPAETPASAAPGVPAAERDKAATG